MNSDLNAMSADEIVRLSREHSLFSWSATDTVNPIPMVRGEGIYFWDATGKRYIDLNSQLMCVNVGHGHPKVIEAIQRQAAELAYAGPNMATPVRARVGRMLAELTPGNLDTFFYTLAGAEANENALRIARIFTGRHKIMSRYRSYHGATAGAISLTGDPRRWANEPGIPGVVRFFDPYAYRSHLYREGDTEAQFTARCLEQLEETIQYEGPKTIAAIILETVTGSNGLIIPPDGYLAGVRALCDRHGILLICDEVMAGFGRTGAWFAVDHWKVVPDLITMAKGLTSAYLPLGAVALSAPIADHFRKNVYYGGLTYNAHPMCLAAAEATLQVMKDEDLVGNARRMGEVMASLLTGLKARHESVGDVRSIGLFGVIEVVRNRQTREGFAAFGQKSAEVGRLGAWLLEQGVYAFVSGNYIFTNPPLCINQAQLEEVFGILDQGLNGLDAEVDRKAS